MREGWFWGGSNYRTRTTYAVLGPAWCFAINAASFVAVLWALGLMRIPADGRVARHASVLVEVREAAEYVVEHRIILLLISSMAVISVFGMSYVTLLPAWAVDVLHGDATTNGLLQSARGVGALVGALMIASQARGAGRGRMWTLGGFVAAVMLGVFAMAGWVPLSLLALVGSGWGLMVLMNTTNALLQMRVPDVLRGRVMGLYALTFFGLLPVGSLAAGALAAHVGLVFTVMVGAIGMLVFALAVAVMVPEVRALD